MPVCHRLFFAVLPPLSCARLIGLVRDGLGNLQTPVRDGRLHLTLWITPDFSSFPGHLAKVLIGIAGTIDTAPAVIALDRLVGSNSSIALRPRRQSAALRDLFLKLDGSLARLGARRPEWKFSPHSTLGYRPGVPFSRAIEPIAWESSEFVLIHSEVGASRHNVLGRWPLLRRQASFDF